MLFVWVLFLAGCEANVTTVTFNYILVIVIQCSYFHSVYFHLYSIQVSVPVFIVQVQFLFTGCILPVSIIQLLVLATGYIVSICIMHVLLLVSFRICGSNLFLKCVIRQELMREYEFATLSCKCDKVVCLQCKS